MSDNKIMHRLAYHYLKVAGIALEAGEVYDANKIARGLSAVYRECKKDEAETKRRISIAGEYFNSKNLSWTPIAVWRDWELIRTWMKREEDKKYIVSKDAIADELADIISAVVRIADCYDIDLEEANLKARKIEMNGCQFLLK